MVPHGNKTLLACQYCGCTDIEDLQWVRVNTFEIVERDVDYQSAFCPQCEAKIPRDRLVQATAWKHFTPTVRQARFK